MGLVQHIVVAVAVVASALAGTVGSLADPVNGELVSLAPTADTFVSESAPSTAYGTVGVLEAAGEPRKEALLRFEVTGVGGGEVLAARLRLYATAAAHSGGQIRGVTGAWHEGTAWTQRPAVDTEIVADLGVLPAAESWYEVDLTGVVVEDGVVELAVTTGYSLGPGASFGSRESRTPPELLLAVDRGPAAPAAPESWVSTLATPFEGSSDATAFASQHRSATTGSGRVLALYGRHLSGVQLAWRDPGDPVWTTATQGAAVDGALAENTETGDWAASVVVVHPPGGEQHAWVAMSGDSAVATKGIFLRRLDELDHPRGPRIGPLVEVVPPGAKAGLVDLGQEAGGGAVALTWAAELVPERYGQLVAWIDDLGSETSAVSEPWTAAAGPSAYRTGTVVTTPTGLAVVHRDGGNALRVAYHRAGDPPTRWDLSGRGMEVPAKAHVAAIGTSTGEIVATSPVDVDEGRIAVQRFDPQRRARPVELSLVGYQAATVAESGGALWLFTVTATGDAVVSRVHRDGTWSREDRIEADRGGAYANPNAGPGHDGHVRVLFEGRQGTAQQRSVLALDRPA